MTITHKLGQKINFSFFILYFALLLMFTSVVSADFTRDTSAQIVIDNATSLQWQDNENITKTWQDAINYCEELTLGSHDDWRLPNINELGSLVDYTRTDPSISTVFNHSTSYYYWSSTTFAYDSRNAWIVYFNYGYQDSYAKDSNRYVRCVRAGQ